MSQSPISGIFVTGTDTGVGKTLVSCAMLRLLRGQGHDAVGFKPVCTGMVNGKWEDAEALAAASDNCEPIERISPLRYKAPKAPTLSARAENIDPDLNLAEWSLSQICERHEYVVIEGIGGLMVPLDEKRLVVDFAWQIGFPVLLVCRAALGTINHTLLSLHLLDAMRLSVAGIVMNVTRVEDGAVAEETKNEIERVSQKRIIAVLPFFESGGTAGEILAQAMESLEAQVDVPKLFGREGTARLTDSKLGDFSRLASK